MAQRVAIDLVDDLDDSEATQTVLFGLDGGSYEIDLNDQHAGELYAVLEPYTQHGRPVGRPRAIRSQIPRRGRAEAPVPVVERSTDPALIRQWAAENGVTVAARGRISAALVERYLAAP